MFLTLLRRLLIAPSLTPKPTLVYPYQLLLFKQKVKCSI